MLIDYVICHELIYAIHADLTGREWQNLPSTVMPDWAERKTRLEVLLKYRLRRPLRPCGS